MTSSTIAATSPRRAKLGALLFIAGAVMTTGCYRGGLPIARYTDFDYRWYPDTQSLSGVKTTELYIRTSDGQTFYLPQLTPGDVGKLNGWNEAKLTTPHEQLFENGMSRFWFENGSLRSFKLYNHSDLDRTTFLLSRSEEGPFMPMPKTKEELVALFGEPNEWTRFHPPTSP